MAAEGSPLWGEASRVVEPAIDVWREGDDMVVALYGEHDMGTAAELARRLWELRAACRGDIAIDLSQTGFIDSSTLQVLVGSHEMLGREGRRLTLRNPSPQARRVLGLAGLLDFVDRTARPDRDPPGPSDLPRTTLVVDGGPETPANHEPDDKMPATDPS